MLSLKQRKALCVTTGKGSWELAETSDMHTGYCQVLSIELTKRWLPRCPAYQPGGCLRTCFSPPLLGFRTWCVISVRICRPKKEMKLT